MNDDRPSETRNSDALRLSHSIHDSQRLRDRPGGAGDGQRSGSSVQSNALGVPSTACTQMSSVNRLTITVSKVAARNGKTRNRMPSPAAMCAATVAYVSGTSG
jgi:hypothetical protein